MDLIHLPTAQVATWDLYVTSSSPELMGSEHPSRSDPGDEPIHSDLLTHDQQPYTSPACRSHTSIHADSHLSFTDGLYPFDRNFRRMSRSRYLLHDLRIDMVSDGVIVLKANDLTASLFLVPCFLVFFFVCVLMSAEIQENEDGILTSAVCFRIPP